MSKELKMMTDQVENPEYEMIDTELYHDVMEYMIKPTKRNSLQLLDRIKENL
jgi:hypothetical protein